MACSSEFNNARKITLKIVKFDLHINITVFDKDEKVIKFKNQWKSAGTQNKVKRENRERDTDEQKQDTGHRNM